jgi:hypothetical protein
LGNDGGRDHEQDSRARKQRAGRSEPGDMGASDVHAPRHLSEIPTEALIALEREDEQPGAAPPHKRAERAWQN